MSELLQIILVICSIVAIINITFFIKFKFRMMFKISMIYACTVGIIAILGYLLGVYGLSLKTMIIIVLPGTFVTIGAVVGLSLFIIRPLGKLTDHADAISRGILDVEGLNIRQKDEIGQLAASFIGMTNVLRYKSDLLERVAEGDFSMKVELASDEDALGKSVSEMAESLSLIIGQVKSSVIQVRAGSDLISTGSQTLSQGAAEQAGTLEELSSSITEMNKQSHDNSSSLSEANEQAVLAKGEALNGSREMENMKEAMSEINTSSMEISKVVKVIDDIAFQINLLALNANVEAARAGKYGKGFAVVADEVRNLAVKSAEAVKETTDMVSVSNARIEDGNRAVDRVGGQLGSIVESNSKVAELLSEVSRAMEEQTASLDQMTKGLEQINEVTQSNSASSEESASASEELAGQAMQLESLVERFKIRDDLAEILLL